jgi:CRISPR/Cas system-associated exonuclease Cas4 (RecB family)/shikimate kinase
MIPILIGQIGAGKTEVGRLLASLIDAHLLSIDDLRLQGIGAGMDDLAAAAIERAPNERLILECTGAADNFEEFLARIAANGQRPYVVLIDCSIERALERIRKRPDWAPPRGGGSWASHLRWTALRLRQVPADFSITTDVMLPRETAEVIASALRQAEQSEPHSIDVLKAGRFSFSQLATYDVCPLAYRYKYIDRQPELLETEAMFLGKRLHEALAFLYAEDVESTAAEEEAQAFLAERMLETIPGTVPPSQRQALSLRAERILKFHYSHVYRHDHAQTLALEKAFTLRLAPRLTFVGTIDRVALAPSGTHEVIDYKSSARKQTSRPRIPDLLQVVAYGTVVLLEYKLSAVRGCRHLLPTAEQESVPIVRADLPRVRAALGRWIERCIRDEDHRPRPGRHCASCQFNPICRSAACPPTSSVLPVLADKSRR